jgi:hypothetical protein
VDSHEVLQIQLLAYNRYFSNKVLGSYGLVLQKVVQDGHLMVTDTLLDLNNKPLPVSDFDMSRSSLHYASPYQ